MSAEDAEVGVTFWVPLPLLGATGTHPLGRQGSGDWVSILRN